MNPKSFSRSNTETVCCLNSTLNERALSHSTATLLLVTLTFLLAAMVLLLFRLPVFTLYSPPSVIQIEKIDSYDEKGRFTCDSRVVLINTGGESYNNGDLQAIFFRNGQKTKGVITTMNGARFVGTHHNGVQTLGGLGSQGKKWDPKERISIDFTDRTFFPADTVRVDIINSPTGEVISRHTRIA